MTSQGRNQKKYVEPDVGKHPVNQLRKASRVKRVSTVYDAVAGRISASGFITDHPVISSVRDTASSSSIAVPPESVLFRRKAAPIRYEESDTYFAHDALSNSALPESDLLKALHCYASDFYSRATITGGREDWRSMDETALLALGIIMEELCRESLGGTGDLVFTEGEVKDDEPRLGPKRDLRAGSSILTKSDAAARSGWTRRGKRRKLQSDGSVDADD